MATKDIHTALYRKYRPKEFGEVLGQEEVVQALTGAIRSGAISHAYLFSGTRGTGKTSIARIFAREIGCTETDLYEIDAASNRGIDDVRELRESVKTLPFESKYKVYIIDEAHMLTKEAFNALLKTLEEPPAHAVFILATTEAHKLPETVLSRCQHFVFNRPTRKTLEELMALVAKKEGYTLVTEALSLVALLGEGSFRDTFGVLEKVLSSVASPKPSLEEIEKITGAPRMALVKSFLENIVAGESGKCLQVIRDARASNVSAPLFLRFVMERLRAAMLMRYAPDMKKEIEEEYGKEDFLFLQTLSKKEAGDKKIPLTEILQEFLSLENSLSRSFIPLLPLELAVVRLCDKKEV